MPHLYTLTLSLVYTVGDEGSVNGESSSSIGTTTQVESCRVGFRTVSISDQGQICLNSRPITVCGLNRHEHDPDHGKVVSLESMKQDIRLLK